MNFPHFFINRPIFAAVLSVLIVIVNGMRLLRGAAAGPRATAVAESPQPAEAAAI